MSELRRSNIRVLLKLGIFLVLVLAIGRLQGYVFVEYGDKTTIDPYKSFKKHRNFMRMDSVNYLVTGYSRAQAAFFEDSLDNGFNFATPGECLPFIYYKLKFIFEESGVAVNTVILPGEYNFLKFVDNHIRYNGRYWRHYFDYLEYGVVSEDPWKWLGKYMKVKLFPDYQLVQVDLHRRMPPNRGGDAKEDKVRFQEMTEEQKMAASEQSVFVKGIPQTELLDESGLAYFNMIVDLCAEHEVNLVCLKLPLHPYYRHYSDISFKDSEMSVKELNEIVASAEGVTVLDFMDYFDGRDYAFKNAHHLSKMGALEFTLMINDTLNTLLAP